MPSLMLPELGQNHAGTVVRFFIAPPPPVDKLNDTPAAPAAALARLLGLVKVEGEVSEKKTNAQDAVTARGQVCQAACFRKSERSRRYATRSITPEGGVEEFMNQVHDPATAQEN